MSLDFSQLINEAIQLELNVAKLYLLFHKLQPEDAAFWWALVIEEQNHAALLKTVEQMDASRVEIPEGIMPPGLAELQESNQMILKLWRILKGNPTEHGLLKWHTRLNDLPGSHTMTTL